MGTRRIKKRIKNFVEHADGSREIPLDAEMQEIIQRQEEDFRKKFGREPGPGDPIFFDPRADTPQPFDPEEIDAAMIEAMVKSNTPHELIYAYLKTDRMVSKENSQFLTDEELQEWNDAINEYRTDERIQTALAKTIADCRQAEKSSDWNHIMCERCWTKIGGPKEHFPAEGFGRCCYCGQMAQSAMKVAGNPESTPCHGKHTQ